MNKIGIIGMGRVGSILRNIIPINAKVMECDKNILPLYNDISKENINKCDYVFICVPTPIGEDDMLDISEIKEVFSWCTVKNICIKSTIPVGTIDFLNQLYPNRNIVFSPEYYGETNCHPYAEHGADWLVLGGESEATKIFANLMQRWYPSNTKIHITDAKTAELAKFMENSFFAMKVSFCNQFYDIANAFGIDYFKLRETWLLDPRIGESHTMVYPEERGYGGKCLPKDIKSITTQAQIKHLSPVLLNSVIASNELFKEV